MAYYRGDYYQGDYYQGDPGLFSSIARVAGRVVGAASRLLPIPGASIVGGLVERATGLLGGRGPAVSPGQVAPFTGQFDVQRYGGVRGTGGIQGQPILGTMGPQAQCAQKGYHPNKAGYFRRTPGGGVAYIEKGSACVRNRRMNPTNGRALKKALRRAYAFKKIAVKTIRLISPTSKAKKFGGFKKTRRSR